MIHGYSVSGNTFTHPSLHPSAAEFFCRQGRDVWVVDLRTSTGLPTATQPWSMEQVALIDIPAALVHIRQASQSRVDVLAHCIGCVMLSMALLTTAQDVRSGPLGEGLGTDLDAGHLDTLERFNRREPDANAPHPCVRKIILSQKGPVLRYTDDNIFRAFVLQTVRRWLLAEGYQFRPPASPTLRDELLDRLLASVPYPQADYDIENPFFPPWKQTPWVGTRHRMDALYGRDFNADQLSDATLEAIDDLFGPIHLDTVAQTIHFNRYNTITDRRGRGDFVTPERLAQRWNGISTLALHGRRNGLVDVSTQDLLTANMRKAGLPFRALPSDRSPYDELGHQDVLIGMASERVFLDVETFLRETAPPALAPAPSSPEFELALPWLGPRLLMPHTGMASLISPGVQLACMSHPAQGKAHLALVPVLRQANGSCQRVGTPTFGPQASSGQWLLCTPDPQPTPPQPPASTGLLALVVHRSADAWVHNGDNWPFSAVMTASAASQVSPAAIDAWLARQAPHELTVAYVDHTALKRAQHLVLASAPTACGPVLAVGSCQYPAGLLDAWPAGASLRKLDRLIGARNVDALLMLGDQIYADATAGLADPTRRDELYEQPHDKALRFLPMQGVLRQIPAYTLPDDHEITDNWAPLPADVGVARPEEDRLNRLQRQHGLAAWRKFQHMHPPWADTQPHPWADQVFQLGGTPVFLLDTRTGRAARGSSVAPAQQHIVQPEQWDLLFAWMLAHPTEPKYVATPALLLPRRSRSAVGTRGHVHSDGWDGYPASLHRLLDFMASHGVRNTVFLSGDEHHSLCAQITVQRPQSPPLRLVSVHCSGFYAPFPFANGNPGQLVPQETFLLPPPQGVAAPVLSVQVETRFLGQANGFATVQACAHGHTCDVQVVFHPAESESPVEVRLSL
jgi:hypothetical protein